MLKLLQNKTTVYPAPKSYPSYFMVPITHCICMMHLSLPLALCLPLLIVLFFFFLSKGHSGSWGRWALSSAGSPGAAMLQECPAPGSAVAGNKELYCHPVGFFLRIKVECRGGGSWRRPCRQGAPLAGSVSEPSCTRP